MYSYAWMADWTAGLFFAASFAVAIITRLMRMPEITWRNFIHFKMCLEYFKDIEIYPSMN